jgi:hypothetical protein
MHARLVRRASAVIIVVAMATTGLAATVGVAGARSSSLIHLVRRVGPIGALARQAATVRTHARARSSVAGAGSENPLDPELYRVHSREGQELEGGNAVHEGEVPAPTATVRSGVSDTQTGLASSFMGSNHFDSRYSDGGNQWSGEPPDQGICANDKREFEIVNSVVQVYGRSGNALLPGTSYFPGTEPVGLSLNQFFGVATSYVRPAGPFGPFVFDVSCSFDPSVHRWFVLADWLTLDTTTGAFAGPGGFYLAVSTSPKPLGTFDVYSVDATNNGTNGTPNHHCSSGFCYGDYPHMGIDRNGVVVTTNEFDNLGAGEFHGAQLYAFSKHDLVAGVASPKMAYIPNIFSHAVDDFAYSMIAVGSLPADRVAAHGGTMYLGMSQSPYADTVAHAVSLWRLTNTSSLNLTPALGLSETSIPTSDYAVPPASRQKKGSTPLLTCENSTACIGADNPDQKGPWPLDSGSGDVGGAWLRHGVVYLVAGAALDDKGGALIAEDGLSWSKIDVHAGVAFVALQPSTTSDYVGLVFQGAADVRGQNLIYPSIALNAAGQGAIGATLSGPDFYPSAAYIPFSTTGPTGPAQVAGAGVGPNDGFTATFDGGYRTRWGDYGAAAVSPDGTVWFGAEYIAQTCGFAEFSADPTCGFTRTFYANWSTRVFAIRP